MKWQPIETAPKDEWVLVYYGEGSMVDTVSIACCRSSYDWADWDGDLYGTPTHWMPLPPPPEASE